MQSHSVLGLLHEARSSVSLSGVLPESTMASRPSARRMLVLEISLDVMLFWTKREIKLTRSERNLGISKSQNWKMLG